MYPVSRCALAAAALGILLPLTACHVSNQKSGPNNNVEIGTPFGSMNVKTNQNAQIAGIGITPYPGATPYKDSDDPHDGDAADVNMNFGSFHLGVKAASYLTHDGRDQVIAFYRKDLSRYGEVLECDGNHAVGQPTRTGQGLTCSDGVHYEGSMNGVHVGSATSLRAGSPQHQHIVGLDSRDGGLKLGLVDLDLPGHLFTHHDGGDSE